MMRTWRCGLLAAAVLGAGAAGPDLSCSSQDTKDTVGQIIGRFLLADYPAERAAKISLSGDLTAIRTVSATDTKHVCKGVLETHAAYTGPTKEVVAAQESDTMKAAEAASRVGDRSLLKAYYATAAGIGELKAIVAANEAAVNGSYDAGSIERRAAQLGEINYTVEATDDGKAYITVLPSQN